MSRKITRRKHIPQRTCIVCREVLPKRSLIRIVRSKEGILIDHHGKIAGRGAYLHNQKKCWEIALKGALSGALKTEINDQDLEMLKEFAANLIDSDAGEEVTILVDNEVVDSQK